MMFQEILNFPLDFNFSLATLLESSNEDFAYKFISNLKCESVNFSVLFENEFSIRFCFTARQCGEL